MMLAVFIILGIFGYIFSCVIAHAVMRSKKGWRQTADTPAPMFWPFIVLFGIFIWWPIMGMVWIVNNTPRLFRKRTKNVSIVK